MSIRYNMDIVDYNDYAINNINEDNRYDKYDVLRKVMYHYLCSWNEESINVKLNLFQNNKEMNTVDILIYSLLKNLSDTIGLKEDSYKSIVISNVEIGNILNKSKEEVYLQMLIDYGQSEMVSILSEIDVKGYFKYYKLAGTSILNGKEFNHYKIYKGSSEYDTKEMSILLNSVVQEAKNLGIKTKDDIELERLLEEWC